MIKLLYLGVREMGRTDTRGRGGRSNYNCEIALNQFDIINHSQALTQER